MDKTRDFVQDRITQLERERDEALAAMEYTLWGIIQVRLDELYKLKEGLIRHGL